MKISKRLPLIGFLLLLSASVAFGVTFVGCTTTGTNTNSGGNSGGGSSSQPVGGTSQPN